MKKILFSTLLIISALFINSVNAEENKKLYISNDDVNYDCPDGQIAASVDFNIDIESTKIINNRFFKDKSNVYTVAIDGHSQICKFYLLENINPDSFEFLNDYYQKDVNNIYYTENYWGWGTPNILKGADVETFEILKEDKLYAMDKNNMYLRGKVLSEQGEKVNNFSLYNNLKGKIVLKVESNGEAYYVHPNKQEMHFLSRPVVAFYVMREQGIGITNNDLEKIPVADNYCPVYSPNCDNPAKYDTAFTQGQKGKIFLQVEGNGEAWYVNPENAKRYFLGRPDDAFQVMRNLGLGISNNDYETITGQDSVKYSITCLDEYKCNLTKTLSSSDITDVFISDILNKLRVIKVLGAYDSAKIISENNDEKIIIEHSAGDACWRANVLYEVSVKTKEIKQLKSLSIESACNTQDADYEQKKLEEEENIKKYNEFKNNLL